MSVHTSMSRARRHLIRLTATALVLSQTWPAWATPTQSPIVNRPEGNPLPNLMLTLDDSGSMTHQYLPEGTFSLNGQKVTLPSDSRLYVHPREISKNIWSATRNFTTTISMGTAPDVTNYKAYYDTRFITAVPKAFESTELTNDSKLYQYQMRSPQVNTIYYNPAISYTRWRSIDGNNNASDFDKPDFKAAKLDPLALDLNRGSTYPAGWVDETSQVDLSETQVYSVYWSQRVEPWNPTVAPQTPPVQKHYNPALLYLLPSGANPNNVGNYLYFDLNDGPSDGTGVVTYPFVYKDRKDCTVTESSTICPRVSERENFANWFTFYRSRLMIAQGALPGILNGVTGYRVGWGTLHQGVQYTSGIPGDTLSVGATYTVDGKPSKTVQHGVREWTGQPKYDFTKWVRTLKTYGGTPTRSAVQSVGDYFRRTDNFSPWSSDMEAGSDISKHLSCRRAYNVLLTDGYYTPLTNADTHVGNVDKDGSFKVDGLRAPFQDSASDTLADYTMDTWLNDLQPEITRLHPRPEEKLKVPPLRVTDSADDNLLAQIKHDPATYLHLNYFFIGFNITGVLLDRAVLDDKGGAVYDARLLELARCGEAGGRCWTDDRVDDMWHAALNARGSYIDVKNAKELAEALNNALNSASTSSFQEGGLATSSASLTAGNIKYAPEYTPYSWTGNLRAWKLDANGKAVSELWVAEDPNLQPEKRKLPSPADRNIYVWNGAHSVALKPGFDFGPASAVLTPELVAFLRGERGADDMRKRSTVLPDFVNSTPLFVKNTPVGGQPATDGLIFVGGNGGMLHAFNTETGREAYAYIPGAVTAKLPKLARVDYGRPGGNFHEYFVDGHLADAQLDNAHRIVVGTLGAGGKAVFALKLNWPAVTTNLDDKTAIWEVTHDDMGYITSTPQFGRMPDGRLKIFVGNGIDSNSGKAALLVIDAATGDVQAIEVPTPPDSGPTPGTSAGLGGVTLINNTQGAVTTIYAGDTLGRVWRFDVDASTGAIEVGYGNTPLFTATTPSNAPQPITASPAVFTHTQGGQIVVVNTGRLLYEADSTSTQLQSAYGIWDKVPTGTSSVSERAPSITRANMQEQVISAGEVINGRTFYDLTSNTISWATSAQDTKGKMGWYMDLALPNGVVNGVQTFLYPKAVYDPIPFGRSVLLTAITPGGKEESCTESKAKGFGFLIKAQTGSKPPIPSVDTDGNNVFNELDKNYSIFTEGGLEQKVLDCVGDKCKKCEGDQCEDPEPPPCSKEGLAMNTGDDITIRDSGCGRIGDRAWRQLLNPPRPK